MKKTLLSLLLVSALFLSVITPGFAETEYPSDPRFDGLSWDDIAYKFLGEHSVPPTSDDVCLGYYNTVTGEEHYINGDQYMDAASMYKVGLNMIYADKIARGELSLDTPFGGVDLRYAQEMTIIHSDNYWAQLMWEDLAANGKTGYRNMREQMCIYMDEDIETVDSQFWENNYNNARQIIACLKKLWEGRDTVYQNIIDCMLRAERENYFLKNPQKVEVAQKYGYVENGPIYINDSGICYTTEPILLVIFTRGVSEQVQLISDYCTLMIDYAEYKTAYDKAEAERMAIQEAEQLAKQQQERERLAAEAREQALLQAQQMSGSGENTSTPQISTTDIPGLTEIAMGIVGICAVLFICIFLFNSAKRKIKMKKLPAALSLLVVMIAMNAIVVGSREGQLVTQYKTRPEPIIESFFSSFELGDYAAAKVLMDNPPDISLSADPNDAVMTLLVQSLKDSFSYEPAGDCITDKTTAVRPYVITYYDLNVATINCKSYIQEIIDEKVDEAYDRTTLLDENNNYKPEFLNEVFNITMEKVAAERDLYLTTKPVSITLEYKDGEWKIQPNSELISALRGGI